MEEVYYPIGEQNFEKIITGGWFYVDKTGYIRRFLKGGYYFLGRPRRFGKSLFLSTLRYFFEGRKDLFKGLEAESFDWDWTPYPVLYIDLNVGNYSGRDGLKDNLENHVLRWEKQYGITPEVSNLAIRLSNIIRAAHETTGKRVVVLVDEYDKPLVNSLGNKDRYEEYKNELAGFYSNFKSSAEHIHLIFLTGVSRFGKISIFSGLNNIRDISTNERFSAICGITEKEIDSRFSQGLEAFSEEKGISVEEIKNNLKVSYDGYHFSAQNIDVYNPFSLLSSMADFKFKNYWIESGGKPTILLEILKSLDIDLHSFFNVRCSEESLSGLDISALNPIALFYQTGYLTIKKYDENSGLFTLGLPNKEVKQGLLEYLLPYYVDLHNESTEFVVSKFVEDFKSGNVDAFMKRLTSLFSSVPYSIAMESDRNIHNALLMLMILVGLRVKTEYQTSEGRIDLLVRTEKYIYIIELKLDGSAEDALRQIDDNNYALPFLSEGREIIRIGINFSTSRRTISEWRMKR